MSKNVYAHIKAYLEKDIYPFHMPGHKRNPRFLPEGLANFDITELPGMDVLGKPTGMLQEMQIKIASFFGAEESFFLVNGSSAGIVAAICAACEERGVLYAARNGHVSMFNGLVMSGAKPNYIQPQQRPDGLVGGLTVNDLEKSGYKAGGTVYIVSPTYEGFTSDITTLAEYIHQQNGILIVDEAHGAHFPFHRAFPQTALEGGADIVINSLHKTLPTMGQTAVLHTQGNRVNRNQLRFFINAMQTTSPSYLLMAAADYALDILWKNPGLFETYVQQLKQFRTEMETAGIPPVPTDDIGKLLFETEDAEETAAIMARDYKVQVEMAQGRHLLAMTSVADTEEGFARLRTALQSLLSGKRGKKTGAKPPNPSPVSQLPDIVINPREAVRQPTVILPVQQAQGQIAVELIAPCPPGIIQIAPGERISEELLHKALT